MRDKNKVFVLYMLLRQGKKTVCSSHTQETTPGYDFPPILAYPTRIAISIELLAY